MHTISIRLRVLSVLWQLAGCLPVIKSGPSEEKKKLETLLVTYLVKQVLDRCLILKWREGRRILKVSLCACALVWFRKLLVTFWPRNLFSINHLIQLNIQYTYKHNSSLTLFPLFVNRSPLAHSINQFSASNSTTSRHKTGENIILLPNIYSGVKEASNSVNWHRYMLLLGNKTWQ